MSTQTQFRALRLVDQGSVHGYLFVGKVRFWNSGRGRPPWHHAINRLRREGWVGPRASDIDSKVPGRRRHADLTAAGRDLLDKLGGA